MNRWTAILALLLCCCFFASASSALAGADAMVVNIYGGFEGCDVYMHTNFFELNPGETAEVRVDFRKCVYLASGLLFYAYVDEMANYAGSKHKLDLYVMDPSTGRVMSPEELGGCYTPGNQAGCWMDIAPGPGPELILAATNVGRKPQLVRLQSSVNVNSPCK